MDSMIRKQLLGQQLRVISLIISRRGRGRVILLGACRSSPDQGACQALEDALILASCHEPVAALRLYKAHRMKPSTALIEQSPHYGKINQWEHRLLRLLRGALTPLAFATFCSRQMRASHCTDVRREKQLVKGRGFHPCKIPYRMVCSERELRESVKEERTMALITRRRWLQEGLALLEEAGAEALTIESLTSRLDVTKGSFYHHFTNYQDFKECLLVFWEEEGTLRIVQLAEKEASPSEKLERVLQASLHPSRLDVALRAWAWQDERVRVHQQRIDQLRLAYLEEVASAHTTDRLSAQQLARMFYSLYVGSQHIIPPIQGEDLRALYQLAQCCFEKERAT